MNAGWRISITIGLILLFITLSNTVLLIRRGCGHRATLAEFYSPLRATHCCDSGADLSHLFLLQMALFNHKMDHGGFPEGLAPILSEYSYLDLGHFHYRKLDDSFEIWVNAESPYGVSYFMDPNGNVYFSETGPANDESPILTNSLIP